MDAFISVPANGLIIHAKRYENAIFCMKWVVKIKEIQKFCYNHQLPIRLVVGKVNDREGYEDAKILQGKYRIFYSAILDTKMHFLHLL